MRQAKGGEAATKRVPLRPSTWGRLWEHKRPGETFSDVIDRLLEAKGNE